MARLGTLLDTVGRPEDRVEIIRRSKKTTRIRRSTNNGRSWSPTDQLVATELILDDGGARFDQHAQNPGHATYLGLAGVPQARLKIQRVYAVITKAQVYLGNNTWSDLQDFPTQDIRFDGGASIGWTIPTWHQPRPAVIAEKDPGAGRHSGGQTPETSIRDTDAGPEGAAVFLHPRLEYRLEPRPPTLDDRPGRQGVP